MTINSEPPEMRATRAGPDPEAERLAYSVDEAAQLTGLSRDLLYDLPYLKVGRQRLITRQHLEQFLGVSS
jgi:excisionase family DNA binding protein